jgi:hypothetical protein
MFGLRGFIDESHDPKSVPKVFNLSCIIGHDSQIPWFEMAWANALEAKNAELTEQGRPKISRYHASDCSNLKGEFEGWAIPEQIEFSHKLLEVFRKHPLHIHSFDLPLQLLLQEIPEVAPNPIGFAYVLLLRFLMTQIGQETLRLYPNDEISLIHDRSEYDGALAGSFDQAIHDPSLPRHGQFFSISSGSWENNLMLQAADFLAYDNFKEGLRNHYPTNKNRRKSLNALLDLESVSGRASGPGTRCVRSRSRARVIGRGAVRRSFYHPKL